MTAFFNSNNCFLNLNQAVWWMKRLCYDPLVFYGDGVSPVLMDISTSGAELGCNLRGKNA